MKIAVCAKYVPVVSRIRFDYEQKTIIREGVPSEVNSFDMLGIVRAVELKSGGADEVVAVSMGPPQARDGLLQCLAMGADKGVLISDRALAGSDTLATARALALTLAREGPDLVICGRNSSDSETGQVGPEVAELMDLPHISQVSKLDYRPDSNTILVRRDTDEGYQVLECQLPALVCVTEGVAEEQFPTRDGMAEAQTKSLDEVSCADLTTDLSQFGVEGSPTWVDDIRLVEPSRLGVIVEEENPEIAAKQVADQLAARLAELDAGSGDAPASGPFPRFPDNREKSIWVVAEMTRGGLRRVTLEMLGKARELTTVTSSEVVAVLIGSQDDRLVNELMCGGADRVVVIDNAGKGLVWGRAVVRALCSALQTASPYAVLFAATADGRDLAARVAAALSLGLTGDAIDLEIDDQGRLVQLKPALGGNVVAPILSKTLPNLVTLRAGLLEPVDPETGIEPLVEHVKVSAFQGAEAQLLEEQIQEDLGSIELTQAQVVMGVGMGIGGPDSLTEIRELAASIGATLATTRDVVHAGWLPHQIQVGISGRTIGPKVYIAVGIRGAFNHTVGIQKAGIIVAVNQMRRHTIFRAADFGIVGDWQTFLPPLIDALRPTLANIR